MTSPLVRFHDKRVILPPRFCGSVGYYALMSAYGNVTVDYDMSFNKRQKETHRTTIADTRGTLSLTVPIAKPVSMTAARWKDIKVSTHGQWWDKMLTALESAYGRTPYFEFYIDRFIPFFRHRQECSCETIADLDAGTDHVIRDILGIPYDTPANNGEAIDDLRHIPLPEPPVVEYYQVRRDSLGFLPGLSIFDLIFNMGPESPIVLQHMTRNF